MFWVSGSGSRLHAAAPLGSYTIPLAHPGAAALNKDHQYDREKHAGNNPDDRRTVHVDSSFLR